MEEVILLTNEKTHELAYRTPGGDMTQEEYLVWLGNMFIEFKKSMKHKK